MIGCSAPTAGDAIAEQDRNRFIETLHSGSRAFAGFMQPVYSVMMDDRTALLEIPAAEFQRDFGRYQDLALTRPVAITRDGHERTVLVSAEEYTRLKRRDRRVMNLADYTADDIEALEQARAPEESKAFDQELKS